MIIIAVRWRSIAVPLLWLHCGFILLHVVLQPPQLWRHTLDLHERTAQVCEGRVSDGLQAYDSGWRVLVDVTHCARDTTMELHHGTVEVRSYEEGAPKLIRGDHVRFRATLYPPRVAMNPGTAYRQWRYYADHIDATATLRNATWIRVITPSTSFIWPRVYEWQQALKQRLTGMLHNTRSYGLASALLLGDSQGIAQADWDTYRRLGLIHILVVSGLHVGVLFGALYCLMLMCARMTPWLLRRTPSWKFIAISALCSTWILTCVLSTRMPAMRAMLCVSAYMLALLFDRRRDAATALALAGLCIISVAPAALLTPTFQMSFLAVGTLLYCAQKGDAQRPWRQRVLQGWRSSVIVGLVMMPCVLWYYQEFSFFGVFASCFIVPLVALIILPLGWFALVLNNSFTGRAINIAFEAFDALLLWCDQFSAWWHTQWTLTVEQALIASFAIATYVLMRVFQDRLRRILVVIAMSCACAIMLYANIESRQLVMHIIDIGQGAAIHLELPNKQHLLIDSGGSVQSDGPDIGAHVLAPALRRLGVRHVTAAYLTHYHPDHYGGFAAIAEQLSIGTLYTHAGNPLDQDPLWHATHQRLLAQRVKRQALGSNVIHRYGDVTIRVLHPNMPARYAHENNRSLVLELTYKQQRWLITGDIERTAEAHLASSGIIQPVTVMLAPHHGSRTSSTQQLLDAARPSHVIIPCGQQNRFGFPHTEVLARLRAHGAKIWRTDIQGMITVRTDGTATQISTFH